MMKMWNVLAMLGVVLVVALLVVVFFAPKEVDYYYVSGENTGECVFAHWTWHTDERVVCTASADDAVRIMQDANVALPKKYPH